MELLTRFSIVAETQKTIVVERRGVPMRNRGVGKEDVVYI